MCTLVTEHGSLMHAQSFLGFVGWLTLVFIAAATGASASARAGDFYAQLHQPSWAPPAWLFGPVWSALYLLMGIAAWLVWRKGGFAQARSALVLFFIQLTLNTSWSWLFFHWHFGLVSCVNIVLLWLMIVATIIAFWRKEPLSGLLLLPYLAWVTFAAVLNITLWILNPTLLS